MAAASRTLFFGFGAYVGAVTGPTLCAWWPEDPQSLGFQPAALIPTDLAKNPMAVRAGLIAVQDLQVDDQRTDGGLTGIGPRFPQGAMVGPVWLADTYYQSLGANRPSRQPPSAAMEAHDYELTSILYWSGPLANRRFNGFHARMLDKNGTVARVEIWHGGRSRIAGEPAAGTWWIDLAADAHPVDPEATMIAAAGDEGALFLDVHAARSLQLAGPKRPPSAGLVDFAEAA